MTLELLATLGALALVDSLSIGTLLIPVFFLIAPRLRAGRMLVYLLTIAGFYLLVGVALTVGATALLTGFQGLLDSTAGLAIQLVLGIGLLVAAFAIPTGRPQAEDGTPRRGRLSRWRDRALDGPRPTAVVTVALAAGLLELATMVPYLGAIGLLSTAPLGTASRLLLLTAYCGIMIAPALLLLVLRVTMRPLVESPLRRLAAWLQRTGAENTAWIIGIVGFLLARSAASELGLFDALTGLGISLG